MKPRDEIEERLRRLEPPAPSEALRARVLERASAAARSAGPLLKETRRAPAWLGWAAAAVVLAAANVLWTPVDDEDESGREEPSEWVELARELNLENTDRFGLARASTSDPERRERLRSLLQEEGFYQ